MDKSNLANRLLRCCSRIWMDSWLLEVLMISLSFLCLVAMTMVLHIADGSTIQVWHGLTLNTLVSILSTGAKAAAMRTSLNFTFGCAYS
jgi:hypothetical protein